AGAVEPDEPARARRGGGVHLREEEGAAVVVLLDLVGDAFQGRGRVVELAGDVDPELRVAEHGVVIDGDAAVGGDDASVGGGDQRVDLHAPGIATAGRREDADHSLGQRGVEAGVDLR